MNLTREILIVYIKANDLFYTDVILEEYSYQELVNIYILVVKLKDANNPHTQTEDPQNKNHKLKPE